MADGAPASGDMFARWAEEARKKKQRMLNELLRLYRVIRPHRRGRYVPASLRKRVLEAVQAEMTYGDPMSGGSCSRYSVPQLMEASALALSLLFSPCEEEFEKRFWRDWKWAY